MRTPYPEGLGVGCTHGPLSSFATDVNIVDRSACVFAIPLTDGTLPHTP